jgi:hypothetical protein
MAELGVVHVAYGAADKMAAAAALVDALGLGWERVAAIGDDWPDLPLEAWKDTCETLHLWTQIVGKVRLALTPWLNHSWHVTLRVSARGLITPAIPLAGRDLSIEFDFIDHVLWLRTSDGHFRQIVLRLRGGAAGWASDRHSSRPSTYATSATAPTP